MEKREKEEWFCIATFGLIAQFIIYSAYKFFNELTIAIIFFGFMVYMIFVMVSYIIGVNIKSKTTK